MEKKTLQDLVDLMARLRAPDGCPWDREQTFATLGPMLIEEAWEVVEASEPGKWSHLRDELGDLLFQIVFYAQIGAENGQFDMGDAITRVHEKMTRRHPHVFGEATVSSTADVLVNWEAIKAAERQAAGTAEEARQSLLDGVSVRVPALLEAHQLTAKASRVGFDWPAIKDVLAKLQEEVGELETELARESREETAVADEIGDMLFVMVNLARKLGVEPEIALKASNRKFRRRFGHIETRLAAQGRTLTESSLSEMDSLWDEAKQLERNLS